MSYHPNLDVWTVLSHPTLQHGSAPAVVWKGKILLGGGTVDLDEANNPTTVIEEYDPNTDTWAFWDTHHSQLDRTLYCHYFLNMDIPGL